MEARMIESLERRLLLSTTPEFVSADFHFETAPHKIIFEFSGDASSIGASDLLLERLSPDGEVSSIDIADLSYDQQTNTATFEPDINRLGMPAGVLESGNYRAVIPAEDTPLAEDAVFDFYFLDADVTRDRIVDGADQDVIVANWQETGKTFSEGDVNYDGVVNVTDLSLMSGNWKAQVPPFWVSATSGMAPFTVFVHTLDVRFSPTDSIDILSNEYEWDFGDTTQGSRYNELRGWNAAHVYDESGVYTITLTRTDESGPQQLGAATITVLEDERQVVHVAEDGDGSTENDGSDPNNPVSLARAKQLLTDDMRLLFRRGDVFDIDLNSRISISHDSVVLGAYGIGDDLPIMNSTVTTGEPASAAIIRVTSSSTNVVIEALAFHSINAPATGRFPATAVGATGKWITVRDTEVFNIDTVLNGNEQPHGVLLKDNVAPWETGLRGYFSWMEGADHVYLGNIVENSTNEHVFRAGATGVDRVLLAENNLRNSGKPTISLQVGQYGYVKNNTLRGEMAVGPLPHGHGNQDFATFEWVLVADNEIRSQVGIANGSANVTVRNNEIIRNGGTAFVINAQDHNLPHRTLENIRIVSNVVSNDAETGRFLLLHGRDGVVTTGRAPGAITLADNYYWAPKLIVQGSSNLAEIWDPDHSLDSFAAIYNNTWPSLQPFSGGVFGFFDLSVFIYRSEAWWLDQPQVNNDIFIEQN